MVAQAVPKTPPVPSQIDDFQTVYITNVNADNSVFEQLSAAVKRWGRWKVVSQSEKADVLLVLSEEKETVSSTFDPMPLFEGVYYLRWPASTTEIDTLTLVAMDRAANRQLLTVSCARHHFPSGPRCLVSRLRRNIEKGEKSDK
ncbi:MAG TPA: hypothetical protein VJX30_16675 [Terriglobales bacterium]|nr:hypothetical protein [Terriglobales bacterium]